LLQTILTSLNHLIAAMIALGYHRSMHECNADFLLLVCDSTPGAFPPEWPCSQFAC
jgi:hypothetical protein